MAYAGYPVGQSGFAAANENGPVHSLDIRLPAHGQTSAQANGAREIMLFVLEGVVEVMVGGAAGLVTAGDFVRVPPDAVYACRNAGDDMARLMVRPARPSRPSDTAA